MAQIRWNMFFVDLLEQGRCSFTFDDIREKYDLSEQRISQELYRYSVKKQIVKIRKGFYGILTPETAINGMLPPDLFVHSLMKSLNKPYYVALLSAAALHGAAHQQPMEYFVITQTPAPRSIRNKKIKLSFVSKKTWEPSSVLQKKTRAGYIQVSSPELTALDLINYADKFGLNSVTTILQELVEEMKPSHLNKIAKKSIEIPVIQRLGYILERILNEDKLADALYKILDNKTIIPTLLSPRKKKQGNLDDKWKVILNSEIETDL